MGNKKNLYSVFCEDFPKEFILFKRQELFRSKKQNLTSKPKFSDVSLEEGRMVCQNGLRKELLTSENFIKNIIHTISPADFDVFCPELRCKIGHAHRMRVMDNVTKNLSDEEYLKYSKERNLGLLERKNMEKFKEFCKNALNNGEQVKFCFDKI